MNLFPFPGHSRRSSSNTTKVLFVVSMQANPFLKFPGQTGLLFFGGNQFFPFTSACMLHRNFQVFCQPCLSYGAGNYVPQRMWGGGGWHSSPGWVQEDWLLRCQNSIWKCKSGRFVPCHGVNTPGQIASPIWFCRFTKSLVRTLAWACR